MAKKQEVVKPGDLVEFIDNPDTWGIVTALSDCGECVYYKPRGIGWMRVGVHIDCLRIALQASRMPIQSS